MIKDIPFYHDSTYRPPPKSVRNPLSERLENIDINQKPNIDFKENSPFQEGVISEHSKGQINCFSKNLKNWKV